MKIAKGIRDTYNEAKGNYQRLAEEVCAKLQLVTADRKWFFLFRIKELESFALKIETGRVEDPTRMEDFFACTIVVPTVSQIIEAEQLVEGMYAVAERRPPQDDLTSKRASDFVFDDLRLYMKRGASDNGRNDDLEGLLFEVQIKTILQHAWGIASHDLIYKADDVSWPKERIAFQVKAMLEHAEIAIAEAERLAISPAISKRDRDTSSISEIIRVLREFWPQDRLPRDVKRLAENIKNMLKVCDVQHQDFLNLLKAERARLGFLPTDLSPYALTVQAMANSSALDFRAKITGSSNKRVKIFVHADMDLPDWMKQPNAKIIRV